jgi:hypothetical protein
LRIVHVVGFRRSGNYSEPVAPYGPFVMTGEEIEESLPDLRGATLVK